MNQQLLGLTEAADAVAKLVDRRAAGVVLDETAYATFTHSVPLRKGVTSAHGARTVGLDVWQRWADGWGRVESSLPDGVRIVRGSSFDERAPQSLVVAGFDAAVAFASTYASRPMRADVPRLGRIAQGLVATGAIMSAASLKQAARLDDHDVAVLASAIDWLNAHPDVTELSERQIPVPGMHTKWLASHRALVRDLLGWDVRASVRHRPPVAHVTYVDPDYLATGARRHDAWTGGDEHALPYPPRTVVIVENRDCRLWFPPLPATVVAEGGGRAATWLLADAPWVRRADHIIYWGDLDADGLEILDGLRGALADPSPSGPERAVRSVLMDASALHEFAYLGVNHDRRGGDIEHTAVDVPHLAPPERDAYYEITTLGPAAVRRVEQERIPMSAVLERIRTVVDASAVESESSVGSE